MWQNHTDKDGKRFASFEKFVTHKLWWGLETNIDDLRAFCRKRPDVDRLIVGEVDPLGAQGRPYLEDANKGDNVTFDRGNSTTYTFKRLKRDAPELFGRVVAGELSASAGGVSSRSIRA